MLIYLEHHLDQRTLAEALQDLVISVGLKRIHLSAVVRRYDSGDLGCAGPRVQGGQNDGEDGT